MQHPWLPYPLIAQVNPETLALMIPIVMIVLGIGASVIKNLAKHQREMAELIHGRNKVADDPQLLHEMSLLRQQVAQLNDKVNSLTIASDQPPALRHQEGLQDRLGQ